ncbi:aspartate aminotransferase family protein [Marinitoga litoralis]|uniref:aspartate aminotransferase family protein n=1 Tax=Marinitoga litoralis TaxID=570855 RepID=UPI001960FBEB|nr:aminotransferase class III-fold pyridoxal phosphate-dependent enzyme [Marinitoga litoralis]MBM7559207.1 acetylornithine/N-succinyldiaminopimelate aminotransferase [Marinitoga litoralis]
MILKMYDYYNLDIDYAEGIYIYNKEGKKYIDTFSGIGVLALGHSNKELIERMKNKMDRYMHLSNYLLDEDAEWVANKLVELTGEKGSVFFTNSGTEATEAALKAIKKLATKDKKKIIYFNNGFHGRTLGALSINGFEKLKAPFWPLIPNCQEFVFNDAEGLKDYMEFHGDEVLAVFVEPIQGSGGVVPLTQEFANVLSYYQKEKNYILVSDEIQAGLGRTGKFYSYEHYNLKPDIITIGKAIGGGLPLGATIFLNDTANILKPGDHGSTFAPNPIALAGARFILENIPNMLDDIKEKGIYFIEKLNSLESFEIADIRGKGLMIGIELIESLSDLKQKAFENNLLLNVIFNNSVIRLLPALNITYEEIDIIINKLEELL